MNPTDEQEAILAVAQTSEHLQIRAYAGCGKTSTLALIDEALGKTPRLCVAFNKPVAVEMAERLRETTDCRTMNSLGHRIWSSTITDRLVLNTRKTLDLFRQAITGKTKDDIKHLWDHYDEIKSAVDLAKAVGYIPKGVPRADRTLIFADDFYRDWCEPMSGLAQATVDDILRQSIKLAYSGNIDFNDQLYMPTLFGGTFPRYPVVMIDEAQDLSPINHMMVERLVGTRRLISVGDPFQSIYAFRGALTNGMDAQFCRFSMVARSLTVSFRCPRAIVENARWRAADFQWLRDGGAVATLRDLDLRTVPDGAVFICRNNAPLFRLAVRFLTVGRSVSVAGTDIGTKLVGILRRFGDESLSRAAVLSRIEEWESERDGASARDMAECLRIFARLGSTLAEAISFAEDILRRQGPIYLTTGHKAKGLEWPIVYHLDPWLLKTDEQDQNLHYVIQTRSSDQYFTINSEDIACE